MKILIKKTLHYYIDKYPIAKNQLTIWHNEFTEKEFSNFNELKKVYRNASILNNNRVVFNIKGNDYRLIVHIDYLRKIVRIKFIGTHSEYDKINAKEI